MTQSDDIQKVMEDKRRLRRLRHNSKRDWGNKGEAKKDGKVFTLASDASQLSQAPPPDDFWSLCRAIGASALEAELIAWGGEAGHHHEPVKALLSGRWLDDDWVRRCLAAIARRRMADEPGWTGEAYPDWPLMLPYVNREVPAPSVPLVQGYDRATETVLAHEFGIVTAPVAVAKIKYK